MPRVILLAALLLAPWCRGSDRGREWAEWVEWARVRYGPAGISVYGEGK